jgi:hypothetical protein
MYVLPRLGGGWEGGLAAGAFKAPKIKRGPAFAGPGGVAVLVDFSVVGVDYVVVLLLLVSGCL